MTVVFYTSAHGFGHLTRDLEVIEEIGRRRPEARIVLRAAEASRLVAASVRVPIEFQALEADTGLVQIDSLRSDEDETARTAARFYAGFDARADEEAAALTRLDASVVVGDIPPLAFEAAARARVPSIALGNFTWDWIYEGYPQFDRLAPGVVALIRSAYSRATRALRLPLHGGFDAMPQVVEDIPLIARRSAIGREGARRALGWGLDETVVLASFGGYGLDVDYERIARGSRFRLIAPGYQAPPRGIRYEDLVAAADVVVSKPGYGIVSECIANGAALLYTSRGRFREHDVFVEEMPKILRCRYIPHQELMAGDWDAAIAALLAEPAPPESPATDGAIRAADAILATAEQRAYGDRL